MAVQSITPPNPVLSVLIPNCFQNKLINSVASVLSVVQKLVQKKDRSGYKNDQFAFVADDDDGLVLIKINDNPSPKGSLILMAGGDIYHHPPYWYATQALANQVHRLFINKGYEDYDIYFTSTSQAWAQRIPTRLCQGKISRHQIPRILIIPPL